MENKLTFSDFVMIKLDAENKSIKLRNGFELFVDTSFDPEKHMTVTGTIYGLPSRLSFTGQPNIGMPWDCPMEARYGDGVICHYLAIHNALKPENRRYVLEGEDRYVLIPYSTIFCLVREGNITPINGYVLIEPCSNPMIERQKERMAKLGLEMVKLNDTTKDQCNYGIVRYIGTANKRYVDDGASDEGVDIAVGDTVVIRKTNDIPLQYNMHAKIDDGKLYWRCQRRNIFARL